MTYPGQTMKALTVRQPWATFIAIRAKLNETRGWKTEYRGPLAVHAGIAPVTLDVLRLPGIEAALRRHCVVPDDARIEQFHELLPLGQILCLANLVGCTKTDILVDAGEIMLTEEFYLGNYEPGRYALRLEVFHSFDEGIPATGKQGFWNFTFPSTPKLETEMTKKNKNKPDTLDEDQVRDEKGAIDSAFSEERPGAPTDPAFDEDEDKDDGGPAEESKPVQMPEVSTFTHAIDPSEFLPPFQKIVFVKLSREDLAIRAEQMAACDVESAQLEVDMANEVKVWKDKIKAVEAKRMTLSAQVTAKGEEREIECRKRINEDTQEAVIFDANTLQVIETYKLTDKELQTELRMADTYRAAADTQKKPKGAKVVKGNFPADKVVGATAAENPDLDRKNDEAVKALAGKKS